jgi:hypothetical protein
MDLSRASTVILNIRPSPALNIPLVEQFPYYDITWLRMAVNAK